MPEIFAPEILKDRRQWLLWKYEAKEGDKKPRKVPYYASGKKRFGTQGDESDRGQLTDFASATRALEGGAYEGLGFAFLPGDGLIGIDLDKMRDPQTGELNDRANGIMKACKSYTEVSPSGTGIHIIVQGETETDRDVASGLEIFCGRQFFCWTGAKIGDNDNIEPLPLPILDKLHKTIAKEREQRIKAANDNAPTPAPKAPRERSANSPYQDDPQRNYEMALLALDCIPSDIDYDLWLKIGMCLQGEFLDDGLPMWDDWSQKGSKYAGKRDLEIHWRSFKRTDLKVGTLFHIAREQFGFVFPKPERKERPKPTPKALPEFPGDPEPITRKVEQSEPTPTENPEKFNFWDIIKPLGYDRERKYFYSVYTRQIRGLTATALNKPNLMELAPLDMWRAQFCKMGDPTKIDWDDAADALMAKAHERGIYNPERVRGRGCWIDEKRTVLHLGDRIICGDKSYHVHKLPTSFIYEFTEPMQGPGDTEISEYELEHLTDLCADFRWEMPASALLLAGWAALAPVCGALKWRPHIWLSGGAGCGKSTILNDFIRPLMAGIDMFVQGNSTEAGIRQKLGSDALPVIFDEAEQNDERERARVQSVLALARQSSSESAAKIIKGTQNGDGKGYHVRSMFAWAAIQAGIKMQADDTRIVVLNLKSRRSEALDAEEGARQSQEWEHLKRRLHRIVNDNLGPKLMVRTMRLMPVIHEAIGVFVRACTEKHGTARLGDTYGTLLAGAWSMMSEEVPTIEQARELVERYSWEVYVEDAHDDESMKALQSIMQVLVRYRSSVSGIELSRTIGELVDDVHDAKFGHMMRSHDEESDVLKRYGIRVEKDEVLIANNNDLMEKALKDKPWGTRWKSYLERLSGARKTPATNFGRGVVQRATAISIKIILQQGAD